MASFLKEFEPLKIELKEIIRATNDFDKTKVIGSGGFGVVYEGELSHSKRLKGMVAIKRLDRKYGQGEPEFWKEITMLSRYTHENIITLIGYCDEGREKILVYEHACNGSLDHHLSSTDLTWTQRIQICLDAARGLEFLHDDKGNQQRVLHRDIKSANVLLDENWNAKVSDMGLAKIGSTHQHTALVTNIVGTIGYLDPMYLQMGILTKESDVYSFGVVLVEVLCGRLCFEDSISRGLPGLVHMWKKNYTDNKLDLLLFQDLNQPLDVSSRSENVFGHRISILRFQEPHDLKKDDYGKIVEAAVHPLVYTSLQELKVLLSKGLLLNKGKTWFSLNDKGQHCVLISIDECLYRLESKNDSSRYSLVNNSRFQVGTYNARKKGFKAVVSTQFLSPGISYIMNLVFKYPKLVKEKTGKQQYIAIRYIIGEEEEIRSSIVHLTDKTENEWLIAGLYQFTTGKKLKSNTVIDLQIKFNNDAQWDDGFEVEGIEFQPVKDVDKLEDDDQVQLDQYKEILEAAYPPLLYRSLHDLKLLLSKGVLLNRGKTWFYLNDNGQHCELISIKECRIPEQKKRFYYSCRYNSRFPVGALSAWRCYFTSRVRTQFLSPYITYTVNLVFKWEVDRYKNNTAKQRHIGLKYKLDGKTKSWISYVAYKREDNWWMVELCRFISDRANIDLEIMFESTSKLVVEGIEFQPLDKAKHEVLEDEEDMQPISDLDDTYWEQKLPNDYDEVIKWSKDGAQWTTKKELYFIFRTGFLINNGQEWFFIDKKGNRCQMLSARATYVTKYSTWKILKIWQSWQTWKALPESRFGEALVVKHDTITFLLDKMKFQILSPHRKYAVYLVYKLPQNQSPFEGPVQVSNTNLGSDDWEEADVWYIYLVCPQTPVIVRGEVDENVHNQVNRLKMKGVPQPRSDGWMEVNVHEFQTDATMGLFPGLKFKSLVKYSLNGLNVLGIELRSL